MATRKKKAAAEPDFEPAQVNDFVRVVAGEREGTYGVVINDTADDGQFTVRSRDSNSDIFVVHPDDLRKSEAGLR